MPPVSYRDQDRLLSPWPVKILDEETFDVTMSLISQLIGSDQQRQTLLYMLMMVTPARGGGRQNKGGGHLTALPLGLWRNSTPF